MINVAGLPANAKVVISTEQIQKRIREMAHQISDDYSGRILHAVCLLENGFLFAADLVRALDLPVICQFIKPDISENKPGNLEIFFFPELDVADGHVLLIEAIVHTGITSEFLLRNLTARGAASVKLATLLDRQSARRVPLQPDYFGFLIDDAYVFGYGLGTPQLGRNLPYLAAAARRGASGAL